MQIMRVMLSGFLVIILTGCAGMGHRQGDVKVTIASLQFLESTLMEQRYLVTLRLQNRAPSALQVSGLSFDLELNGKSFASGVSNQQVSVAAFDEAMMEVKVSSTLFGIIRQFQILQEPQSRALDYQISGRVYLGNGFYNLPFQEVGELDLRVPAPAQ
jgi:LEA14-like dessication related protein